jgi:hypothetical protein
MARRIGTALVGVALATTGAAALAGPAQAAAPGCELYFLSPNGAEAWCGWSSGTYYQVMIRCVTPNYYAYYRTGPWLSPGTSPSSRVYCDVSADRRTWAAVNTPE